MTKNPHTNGRVRLKKEGLQYLEDLLHDEWVDIAILRAAARDDGTEDLGEYNHQMRLITAIQQELARTRDDMGWDDDA